MGSLYQRLTDRVESRCSVAALGGNKEVSVVASLLHIAWTRRIDVSILLYRLFEL